MRLLKRASLETTASAQSDARSAQLAFVLLAEARLPRAEDIIRAYAALPSRRNRASTLDEHLEKASSDEIVSLSFRSKEPAFIALVPAAVPNGEADEGAQFSMSSLGTGWQLPPHTAHLLVTLASSGSLTAVEELSRFTSLLAAVVLSSDAVGVYWGAAGATHDPQFFVALSQEPGVSPRIMLWSGLSVARDSEGRLSLLSLGMKQLHLPDLLLVASEASEDSALETFFDLLGYLAARGKPLPEGDTVGRTAQERLRVHYVPSPVDPTARVWRVELP